MRNSLIIPLLSLFLIHNSFGQTESEFEFESFRTVVKAVYAFIQDYELTRENLEEMEQEGKNSVEAFLKDLSPNDSIPLKQNEFETILKYKGWSNQGIRLYNKLLESRKNQIQGNKALVAILDIDQEEIPGPNGANIRKDDYWEALRIDLIEQVSAFKADENKINIPSESKDDPVIESSPSIRSRNNKYSLLIHILIGAAFLGLGFFLGSKIAAIRLKNERQQKRSANEKKLYSDQQVLLKGKDTKIKSLESQLEHFKRKNNQLYQKLISLKAVEQPKESQIITEERVVREEKKPAEKLTYYFQYPDSNGSFKKAFGKSTQGPDSYYELSYEEGDSYALLKFVADRNSHGKILSLRDSSLRPVCDIENPSKNSKPTRIEVIEDGKLMIKQDSFEIDQNHKIKIRVS